MGSKLLICDQFNNRVIKTTLRGDIVWQYGLGPQNFTCESVIGPVSAEIIGRSTLIACSGIPPGIVFDALQGVVDNRVVLINKHKEIVWQYGQFGKTGITHNLLNMPSYAAFIICNPNRKSENDDRKNDGSRSSDGEVDVDILITDRGNNRVIRVNANHHIVWQYPNIKSKLCLNMPSSAIAVGDNYLIADEGNNRALEVDCDCDVVKIFTAGGTLGQCSFAKRLCNGNTLLVDQTNSRVVEVNCDDCIVWQYITDSEALSVITPQPTRAFRNEDGSTMIADYLNNRIIEVGIKNTIVGYYGLPMVGNTDLIGTNIGYNPLTTQLGLFGPIDIKVICD